MFINETWTATNMARSHGRCHRGERLRMGYPHGHRKTTTLVAERLRKSLCRCAYRPKAAHTKRTWEEEANLVGERLPQRRRRGDAAGTLGKTRRPPSDRLRLAPAGKAQGRVAKVGTQRIWLVSLSQASSSGIRTDWRVVIMTTQSRRPSSASRPCSAKPASEPSPACSPSSASSSPLPATGMRQLL